MMANPLSQIIKTGPASYRAVNTRLILNRRANLSRDLVLWLKAIPGLLPGQSWLDVTRLHRLAAGTTDLPSSNIDHSPGGHSSCRFANNANQYYAVTSDLLKLHNTSWTFACWVNSASLNEDAIFSAHVTTIYLGPNFVLKRDNGANAGAWDGFSWRELTTAVAANTWTHVAFTYDRTALVLKCFHNGRLSDTHSSVTTDFSAESGTVWMGRRHVAIGQAPFDGQIDDLMVWRGRALSDAQVYDLFRETSRSCPSLINRWSPPVFVSLSDQSPIRGRRRAGIVGGI